MLAKESETSTPDTGLSYEDYLRLLLATMKKATLTERAMDIVEADIRKTLGNENFRMDACVDWIDAQMHVGSNFGHRYEIDRQKRYE
jgi:hypothetical protein